MQQLATITLNRFGGGEDIGIFVPDVLYWEAKTGGGAIVYFRDGRPPIQVTESAADIQTSINALWDEYTTALGNP